MWVNKELFQRVLDDNKQQADTIQTQIIGLTSLHGESQLLKTQKAKDDSHIDWLRHRVNALEKQNAVLMQKAAGIAMPVPEIIPTLARTIGGTPDFDHIPSFEDVGEDEARRLGIDHDDEGRLTYTR
jgi:hypothetical protein